jgi:GNAT superfamily N-acetyltransferase
MSLLLAPAGADPQARFESSVGRGAEILDALEVPNWAPWLRFSAEELDAQSEVFPAGQLLACDDTTRPLASLSTNRIDWDGMIEHLPTWDRVAGKTRTYRDTCVPNGNAIVLMSANVRPDARGRGITRLLIDQVKRVAAAERIEHILSDFRPSEYGAYNMEQGEVGFATYCAMARRDGLPLDSWLRSVTRNGMQPLGVDSRAMVVRTTVAEFSHHRATYRPNCWYRLIDPNVISIRMAEHTPQLDLHDIDEVWECRETGTWYVDRCGGQALYVESNLWGRLPRTAHGC